MKRKPKKISPSHLLYGLFILVLGGGNSLTNLAIKISLLNDCTLSKQAVFKRINESLIVFLQSILSFAIIRNSNVKREPSFDNSLFSNFKRVILQDSTNIKLNKKLAQDFPGNRNKSGKVNAILKIQAVIDILTEQFCHFDISPFTKNDQSVSGDILQFARPSDLIIRDLGYFSCSVFKKLQLNNIFFFESPENERCRIKNR